MAEWVKVLAGKFHLLSVVPVSRTIQQKENRLLTATHRAFPFLILFPFLLRRSACPEVRLLDFKVIISGFLRDHHNLFIAACPIFHSHPQVQGSLRFYSYANISFKKQKQKPVARIPG